MRFPVLNSYNRKLFVYYLLLFVLVFTAVALFQFKREKSAKVDQLDTLLLKYNHLAHNFLGADTLEISALDNYEKYIPDSALRITLIGLDGAVLYDNIVKSYSQMENHFHRPEVQLALKVGTGTDRHMSSSVNNVEYYYFAKKYQGIIVRTALPYGSFVVDYLKVELVALLYLIIIFVSGGIVLFLITERLGHSISQLEAFATTAGENGMVDLNIQFPQNALGVIGNQIVQIYKSLKAAQDELSYEREKLFKHLHTSQEGLAIFSKDRKEILANNYFIQYANLLADSQVVWSDEVFVMEAFGPINKFLDTNLDSKFENEFSVMRESLIIRKNNNTFSLNCIIFADKTFEIVVNDVTKKEQEVKMKRELTSNISHELKTPVSSIKGYLETIVSNPNLPEDKKQFFLKRSYLQSQRLADLVQDIATINKMEEADEFIEKEAFDVAEIIESTIEDVHLRLEERKITPKLNLPAEIAITGNRSMIYSIFRNLVDNAIDYAGENIEIQINCYREDKYSFYFSVFDTGNGIPDDSLGRLFERFYRVDFGRARKNGGTGLGLSIVKNAVIIHGGQISVKNRVEGGLEFLFTLAK